jgi:hypothetical protein
MRRSRRYILRVALGLAIAASVPATAQAAELGVRGQQSDDRDYPAWAKQMETPYWSMAGAGSSTSPDDRSFARTTSVETSPVMSSDGRSIEFNTYTAGGFVLTLLLAISSGMGLGLWYSRKTKLSPA